MTLSAAASSEVCAVLICAVQTPKTHSLVVAAAAPLFSVKHATLAAAQTLPLFVFAAAYQSAGTSLSTPFFFTRAAYRGRSH